MEQNTAGGPAADDEDDFVVAQDTEFAEPYLPADDDERELDDVDLDDVEGIDAERRVTLPEEPGVLDEE